MPGEPIVLVSGRGGHVRSFVAALARFPAEPQWAVVGGFAVYVRIRDVHRITNDLDAVSRNQPSLVEILVAELDADRLAAAKLQLNQDGAAVIVDVMADTADTPLPPEPGERAFALARRMALATSESTELVVVEVRPSSPRRALRSQPRPRSSPSRPSPSRSARRATARRRSAPTSTISSVSCIPERELSEVRFYTGVPAPSVNRFWHDFWTNKCRYLRNQGVHVYTGRVNSAGQEKGVDVSLALDHRWCSSPAVHAVADQLLQVVEAPHDAADPLTVGLLPS